MKKFYLNILFAFLAMGSHAQTIISASPFTIPSAGPCTLTIVGHETYFLSHGVSYASLTQTYNSDGSSFYSSSETVISDDTVQAIFNIVAPNHGGFYTVSVFAFGITINNLPEGVYMTGTDPKRINAITPDYAAASTILTTTITGSQMHFTTSTGFQQVNSVTLQSEIDNSFIYNSTISYLDTNNMNVDFNFPYNVTNGKYRLNVNYINGVNTSREHFFTVVGGVPKHIISVTPHDGLKGDSINLIIHVTGRNLITNPCSSVSFVAELANYSLYLYSNSLTVVDSNHLQVRGLFPLNACEGDYTITLNGFPSLSKHFAFRIKPPNVSGYVYYDADSNGVQTVGELGLVGKKVMLLPDSIVSITDENGKYFFNADPGSYVITYVADTICALSSSPASYNLTVVDTIYSGMDFGLTCPASQEHEFTLWKHDLRCSTTGYSYWRIKNPSYGIQQGRITFIHSSNLPVIFTTIAPDSIIGDTLIWYYTLNSHQTITCNVNFQDPPAMTPVWYVCNDEIFNLFYTDTFQFVTNCSCDPNDKSVWPQEDALHPTTLNTRELSYNINFQNTGTDTAFLVVIVDTISPFLDLNTFQVIGASNDMIANIDYPNRIITFTLDNILLPDSNVDEPGSHGFVQYKIRALQGNPDSVTVNNTAYIYFDFNPAVITNMVTSHLVYYLLPVSSFTTASSSICQLSCIDFTSTSIQATSWQWSFAGGIPSSSTDENPQGICFLNTGTFDVTLVASNGFGSDTLYLPNYLTVNVLPPPPVIYESNDTLYCVVDPLYTAYQWYDTTGIIPGATNSFYVPSTSGLYGLSVYNQQGCEAASSLPIMLAVQEPLLDDFALFPNPASGMLHIRSGLIGNVSIVITTALGKEVYSAEQNFSNHSTADVDVRNLSPGIYFVKFHSDDSRNLDRTIQKHFVKD